MQSSDSKFPLLLQLDGLIEGTIVKRPSKIIKSPYVSDIKLENDTNYTAHTPSLGCCGLADNGANVLISIAPKTKKGTDTKCEYRVYLSILTERNRETIIGIYPKLAEEIVESCLKQNLLTKLRNIKSYKRETSICIEGKVKSRFDFTGVDEKGLSFILEVKNVPNADYEDITSKEKKKKIYTNRDYDSKIAIFPSGNGKINTKPVSVRALKHIKEIAIIKSETKTRCIMCYVVQRDDVISFQPSFLDLSYREEVRNAINSGVEIYVIVVKWTREGKAYFIKDDLMINIEM
jgi:DNA-binding sugar fermentation-stimulating protein